MKIEDKVKIGGKDIPVKWIAVAVAVLAALIIIAYLSWPSRGPGNAAQVLTDSTKKELATKEAELVKKKLEVENYRRQLTQSEARYRVLVQKYLDIQKEKENVTQPTTSAELRDRFAAAGFPMLSGR